jgi:hypothetical protein
MRKWFVTISAVITFGAVADGARAEKNIPLGKHSYGDISAACTRAGGNMWSFSRYYGCTKENCDGKDGTCAVTCDAETNECLGMTPGRTAPPPGKYDLVKILKFSPRVSPERGLLEPGQGAAPHGPSGLGTPKPTAPPPALR